MRTRRPRPLLVLVALVALVVGLVGCGDDDDASTTCDDGGDTDACVDGDATVAAEGDTSGARIPLGDGEALVWGSGPQGVVLAHGAAFDAASWEDQATAIADQGGTALAVEDISPEGIGAAVDELRSRDGVEQVILLGGSAGADAILDLASTDPDVADGLILISPNSTVDGLGDEPKLFIASEGETVADVAPELAETAPGDDDRVLLLPGDGHAQNIFDTDQAQPLMDAILQRLLEQAPA